MMFIEIIQNETGEWFWHIKAANGEILAVSETMANRGDATQIVGKVRANLLRCNVFTITKDGARLQVMGTV
jgi:uncharacterized protein YegP (UPF0339 family)